MALLPANDLRGLASEKNVPPCPNDAPDLGVFTQDTGLEPRLAARWSPFDRVTLKAAWGRFHQAPAPADLSAAFGNPTLGISRAEHWLGGANVRLGDTVSTEVVGFYSHSDDLVSRSSAETFTVSPER